MFKNKILLITGGTGSFGNAILKAFIDSELKEIRIFSRDEKKQDDMRKIYSNSKVKFYIGDVRDENSIENAMRNVDYVFHAAALKQVPSCEFFPLEAVKTNVIGTQNVLEAAIKNKVKKVICLSTDKAAYPINAMGMSKALMEKTAIAKGRQLGKGETVICLTRYGNVMASRGSVIPLFKEQIESGLPVTITNGEMTRFMMTIEDAVLLVIYAFKNGDQGDIFIQKAPAATIDTLVQAMSKKIGKNCKIKNIGTRHGEKLYEVLVTKEEMSKAKDEGSYFRIPADDKDLNYELYETIGDSKIKEYTEYNSHNTNRLDLDSMVKLLDKISILNNK